MFFVFWFEMLLMNVVQCDLVGWFSEKLSECSVLLCLNDVIVVIFSVCQKWLFMVSIYSCEFVVEGLVIWFVCGKICVY